MRPNGRLDFIRRAGCSASLVALLWTGFVAGAHAEDGYAQDAASGCIVFKPNLKASEAVAWQGACVKGQASGPGVAKWAASDGSTLVFEGMFALGKLQGEGRMTASGGDRYLGSYKDGKRDGRGIYVSANQDRFEGQYKDNQRHGHGILTLASGQRTEGEWANGVMVATTAPLAPMPPTTTAAVAGTAAVAPAAQALQETTPQATALSQARVDAAQAKSEAVALTPKQLAQQQLVARQQQQQLERQKAQEERAAQQLELQQQQSAQQAERRRTFEQQQTFNRIFSWLVLSLPLLLAALVWQLKSRHAVAASDKLGGWVDRREAKAREKSGYFANFVEQPFMWCSRKLFEFTSSIADQFLRAGVRLALWVYLFGLVLFLAYAVTMFVLGLALVVGLFYLLGAVLGGDKDESQSSSSGSSGYVPRPSYAFAEGESRGRKDFFGDEYAETRDADGKVIAETRNRKDFFGDKYAETRDADGNVVGESRERDGFLGPYTDHKRV